MKIHIALLKQSKPRLWLGGIRDMMQRLQSYQGLLNGLLLLATVYTVREKTIIKHLPWMTFAIFVGVIAVGMIIIGIVDYKLVHPSQIAYQQHEAYKHRSLLRKDLETANERQQKIVKRQEDMDKKLDKILGVLNEKHG